MNLLKKLISKVNKDYLSDANFDDFLSFEETLDRSSKYPISQYEAFNIAKNYLKNDFVKRESRRITYLSFESGIIKLNKDYSSWDIRINKGLISWDEDGTLCDGFLVKDDFKKLHCLVSTQDGTYKYLDK